MNNKELRISVQEMETIQIGKNKRNGHSKMTEVTSYVKKIDVINFIDQLEEPEQKKPVISQFWADNIEQCKSAGITIRDALNQALLDTESEEELYSKAWFGYTVEKEKLYRVRLPMTVWDEDSSELQEHWYYLVYDNTSDETRLTQSLRAYDRYQHYQTDLSETSIKSIDERYWAFAEEVTE